MVINISEIIRELKPTDREVFEQIAIGNDRSHSPGEYLRLLKLGLIVITGMRSIGHDRLGVIEVPIYEVPVNVHIVWCEMCSVLTTAECND